jgi:hypothetical protein
MRVECYSRTDLGWDLVSLTRPSEDLMFASLLFTMKLSDVYDGVTLPLG